MGLRPTASACSRRTPTGTTRGEAAVSSAIIARIADALLVPMSALASSKVPEEAVIRAGEGPSTVNQGGVTWQELGAPGHDLEPAILTVPSGEGSGGSYSRAGETVCPAPERRARVHRAEPGAADDPAEAGRCADDPAARDVRVAQPGRGTSRALWVESLISRPVVTAAGPTR